MHNVMSRARLQAPNVKRSTGGDSSTTTPGPVFVCQIIFKNKRINVEKQARCISAKPKLKAHYKSTSTNK